MQIILKPLLYCGAMHRYCLFLTLLTTLASAQGAPTPVTVTKTQIVFLGTGTPAIDPDRSGPAVLIVVNDSPYLVDFGAGVVRRAQQAMQRGCQGCDPRKIVTVFSTHLHSDHTAGLSDLYLTPAVVGRAKPLELYGPVGLADMARLIREAYKKDFEIRTRGLQQGNPAPYDMHVHEIKPGLVYQDANVKVTAFLVPHGSWDQAFGYRFDTADRSIVISGDTSKSEAIVQACNGCDVLIHEVFSPIPPVSARWAAYEKAFHTSPSELADVATRARPKLLILYHTSGLPSDPLSDMKRLYKGVVVNAADLDVF